MIIRYNIKRILLLWPYSLFFIAIFTFFNSRYSIAYFHTTNILIYLFTILLYTPFFLIIILKLIDIFVCKTFDRLSILISIFIAYYISITIYRLIVGLEFKESIYYTLIVIGNISYYSLFKKYINDVNYLSKIILKFVLFIIIYQFFFLIFGHLVFQTNPINTNIIVGLLLMFFSFLCYKEIYIDIDSKLNIIYFSLIIVLLINTGSRAGFYLSMIEIGVLFFVFLREKKAVKYLLTILISAGIVILLSYFNIFNILDSIERESGISISNITTLNLNKKNEKQDCNIDFKEKFNYSQLSDSNQDNPNQYKTDENSNEIESQINSSDKMRSDLLKMGIQQFKENPLFGTGDLYYIYTVSEESVFKQTAHNIIIETLCCYGLFGLVMLIVIFLIILQEVFNKFFRPFSINKSIIVFITLFLFFSIAMVQPLGYDSLNQTLLILLLLVFSQDDEKLQYRKLY